MGAPDVLQLAGQFGPMGLIVAYLMWRETRTEKLAKERIEADKSLAVSLAMLTAALNGIPRDV